MKKMKFVHMRISFLIPLCLLLSNCAFFQDEILSKPVDKPTLELAPQEPLDIKPLNWKLIKDKEIIYYGLDQKNYNIFIMNQENILNRMYLNSEYLKKYKNYYEEK